MNGFEIIKNKCNKKSQNLIIIGYDDRKIDKLGNERIQGYNGPKVFRFMCVV